MNSKACGYIDEHRDEMLADIGRLVAINSVRSQPLEGMPFGRGPREAEKLAMDIMRRKGLEPKDIDGYACEADIGEGEPRLGILCHLDTVEAGTGWVLSEPFKMKTAEGRIYGRGTSDDKGPAMAALYGLLAAREACPKLRRTRLIFGCAEETGSEDMEHYFSVRPVPEHVFSPDADFPLINVEKGRYAPFFGAEYDSESEKRLPVHIVFFHGGKVANAAPGEAECLVTGLTAAGTAPAARTAGSMTHVRFEREDRDGGLYIKAVGHTAHASTPLLGDNAQTALLTLLTMLPLTDCATTRAVRSLAQLFPHGSTDGKALDIAASDSSGELTVSFDILDIAGGKIEGLCDMRLPVCVSAPHLVGVFGGKLAKSGLRFTADARPAPPHVVPASSPFVKTLLDVYTEFTGSPAEARATGGGTYVHDIDGGVAFGCQMPGLDTHMHGPDEFSVIDDLVLSAKMFAEATIRICG